MAKLRQATLLFLIKDDTILLAMKKRGFGAGHWNGVGGKPDPGEDIKDTAVRECREEIGVTPAKFEHIATLDFFFPKANKDWNQRVITYFCTEWKGEPVETEEMAPKWFKLSDIPYKEMWPDDKYWLPEVLNGRKIKATFEFDEHGQVDKHEINTNLSTCTPT